MQERPRSPELDWRDMRAFWNNAERQRLLATLNNLVIRLIRCCDNFDYISKGRCYFNANYDKALQLLL